MKLGAAIGTAGGVLTLVAFVVTASFYIHDIEVQAGSNAEAVKANEKRLTPVEAAVVKLSEFHIADNAKKEGKKEGEKETIKRLCREGKLSGKDCE